LREQWRRAAARAIDVSDPLLGVVFGVGVVVSLGFSWVLVIRLERVGARMGLSEGLLGMLAALAADAPEITAAVTALVRNDQRVGAGVVIGSNVFNLAALLGLSAVVAGQIALHRRVVELGGAVAMWIAAVCLLVVTGVLSSLLGLLLAVAALGPYVAILGTDHERLARLALPSAWTRWLIAAVSEEEVELEVAIHPRRGGARDAFAAAAAVLVVVGASIAMERSGTELGTRHGISEIVVGALVLAAVTSLPNAVAAVYLAARGRGAATLSTALNSNALNVVAGLLLPTAILGLGPPSGQTTFVAASYLALTAFALSAAYAGRGLRRPVGMVIIAAYVAFAAVLIAAG
jgi:cation:H+ antiporter